MQIEFSFSISDSSFSISIAPLIVIFLFQFSTKYVIILQIIGLKKGLIIMTNLLAKDKKELSNKINHLRQVMYYVGTQEGLNAAETIQVSQELDKLIVKYQILVMQGRE